MDGKAVSVVNIVNMTEGELSGALPSQLTEETAFFFNVRNIVRDEYEKYKGN